MAEHICGLYHTLGNQAIDYEWARLEELILIYVGVSQYDFQVMKDNCTELGLGGSDYIAG